MDPGDGLQIYPCRRCNRNLTNQPDEQQWHWDNFRENVLLFWKAHGRVNASGILCIQCMNRENFGGPHEAPDHQNWPWTGKGGQALGKGKGKETKKGAGIPRTPDQQGKGTKKGAGIPRTPDQQGKGKGKGKEESDGEGSEESGGSV
jgi:hypothetical protein